MSYEDLLGRISRSIPELTGKLSAPRVTYVKSLKKTYITFESTVLAGEKEFLKLEKILRDMFPGRPLALRVKSPALGESFLAEPEKYRDLIVRLWGVSAHFVDLPRNLQDEMIARFEA